MAETKLSCQDLIVGGGMQGMMAARSCSQLGRDFILIDMAQALGGILKPVELGGYTLDPGCHIWGHRERNNIDFFEQELGIRMIPVVGHCEISISDDGIPRRKLAVPSFESRDTSTRMEAASLAAQVTTDQLASWSFSEICHEALGPDLGESLLGSAAKLYGRDPADLSIEAVRQMAISRIKLHTCHELAQIREQPHDLGPLLCSHPLDEKSDEFTKFWYPSGGLGHLLAEYLGWLQCRAQSLHFGESPRELHLGEPGTHGVLRTRDKSIRFERIMWCCNPLALSSLMDWDKPARESTAGSPFRTFFFRLDDAGHPVEYSHDFRVESPIFRSWVPPMEMAPDSRSRFVIVESPIAKPGAEVVAHMTVELERIHELGSGQLHHLGSKSQVRFYPTMSYLGWLGNFTSNCTSAEKGVLIPPAPLYGKDVITDWWERACHPQ